MSEFLNRLRNYDFLHITKSVTEDQMALYNQPNETWGQIGSKLCKISWYNTKSILAVPMDVATYLFVSTLRSGGFCLPTYPEPPAFPVPHDNVEFFNNAIRRALWDWQPEVRKEIEEGIHDSFSDKWNVFQVVGEWTLAYSYENMKKSPAYKPTFLTVSEPLETGESFRSVGADFIRLKQSDKSGILRALYHQIEPKYLSSTAKKVYQDMRSLASLLHQGNQGYLNTFKEYTQQKAAEEPYADPIRGIREPYRAPRFGELTSPRNPNSSSSSESPTYDYPKLDERTLFQDQQANPWQPARKY